jgi:hypothetical protein
MMAATPAVLALIAAIAPLLTAVATLVSAIAALVSAGLAASLAVARAALIPLEMASASAPAPSAAILALLGIFPAAARLAGSLGLRRSGRTAKELLHPREEAARFLWRRRLGRRRGFRPG